nr:hypothetical protein [Tanacetum cinerariifolium]
TPSANFKTSYDNVANKLESLIDNQLMTVPTDIDEFGNELVVFDEELINDGSRRWKLTLCGFFVGFKMRINELRFNGVGRIRYARVLIEVPAKKGLPDKIDIVYKNDAKEIIGQKTVKVIYDWAPCVCSKCEVFVHNVKMCHKSTDAVNEDQPNVACKVQRGKQQHNEFTEVVNKKIGKQNNNKRSNSDVTKENIATQEGIKKVSDDTPKKGKGKNDKLESLVVQKENRSANKYSVLENLEDEGEFYEVEDTTVEMEDVYSMNDGMARDMNEGDLKGMIEHVL